MDYKERQIEHNRCFIKSWQYLAKLGIEFNDLKSDQSLFSPQVNSNSSYDTNSSCSRNTDRNVGLQVVPSFDDEVFADAFFPHIDYAEQKGICQNQIGTKYQLPTENVGKLFESLACLREEGVIGEDERTESSGLQINTGENEGNSSERRRQSDTDSLDVYLKPCVITPTKVEDLYSTLEEEDNVIFQFPPNKDSSPTSSRSDVRTVQENEAPSDSNVFQIQLCNLSHHKDLNIESSTGKDLNSARHRNEFFEEASRCSMTDMESSHRLARHQSPRLEPQITTDKDNPTHIRSFSSDTTQHKESLEFPENSSFFPPLCKELSSERNLPPKPTNISRGVCNLITSFDFNNKEYLDVRNKSEQQYIPGDQKSRKDFLSRETSKEGTVTAMNVFQKNSETTVQHQERTIASRRDEERPAGLHKLDIQHFKHISRHPKTLEKEGCINMFSPKNDNSKKAVVEMSNGEVQDKLVMREQALRDTRMNHNDTEKQRRDQMKSRFESLRQVIPRIDKLEKTPKIQILKQAWKYISYLEGEGRTLELMKIKEKEKNQALLKKLQNIVKI